MPSRNIVKEFAPESYYHVYNRGVEKRLIFLDDQDYTVFLGILKKYLTGEASNKQNRHIFKSFQGKISLLAYCLMPNHFHLLFYQSNEENITDLMRRVCTGYVMYFNHRHQRVGGLFEGIFRASRVDADGYLHHISRYIHLNPDDYKNWAYSSYSVYMGAKKTKWVNTEPILGLFNNDRKEYQEFLDDYVDTKAELAILKHQLANDV